MGSIEGAGALLSLSELTGLRMNTARFLSDEELIRQAAELLIEKLGEVEAFRFFALPQKERQDSVTRHRIWQESLNKDAFFREVFD